MAWKKHCHFFLVYHEVCHFGVDNACVGCSGPSDQIFCFENVFFHTLYSSHLEKIRTRAMWSLPPLDQLYHNCRQLFWIYTELKERLPWWTVFKRNTRITSVPSVKSVTGLCLLFMDQYCPVWFSLNLTAHLKMLVNSPVNVSTFGGAICKT